MRWLWMILSFLRDFFRGRLALATEMLAYRQQLSAYKTKKKKPKLHWQDRAFWILLSTRWPKWKSALAVVKPQTVIGWHRTMFKVYWTWKSRRKKKPGRPTVSHEIRELIQRMTRENPTWGAPRIVKELALLGYTVSESTVHRFRDRSSKPPSQTWRMFLKNHKPETVAIDFFTVPTVSFSILYCFIILDHARRRILHFNLTYRPSAQWAAFQVLQAFPYNMAPRFLLRDNDTIYGIYFRERIRSMNIKEVTISPHCPWQNPYAERVIGSIRRDCLDHMIILGEDHLHAVLSEYFRYYHEVRCHESLNGNSPIPREAETGSDRINAIPFLGGLHHRYTRSAA